MKKGQTSVRGGIQDFLHPCGDMYITQGAGDSFSHKGTMANDIRGLKAGVKYAYYAPCDVKCLYTIPDNGQAFWQSVNKVRFSNGNVDYATFITCHDDSLDIKKGQVVKQGNQLGNMGKKGGATGVHLHIEIAQKKYAVKDFKKNKYGTNSFPTEVDTDDCFFMDNTNIMNCKTANWKYLKDVPVKTYKTIGATAGLWLREKKGTSSKKLKLLLYGNKVELLTANAGSANGYQWSKVKSGNITGYVASMYLR